MTPSLKITPVYIATGAGLTVNSKEVKRGSQLTAARVTSCIKKNSLNRNSSASGIQDK
jgi:hypothetical protein